MSGRWVNNIWLGEHDIMENLCAERDNLEGSLSFINRKIEAIRHEQYIVYREFIEGEKKK